MGFVNVKAKRVTDPLDEKAKARLVGGQLSYVSSGSEHSADGSPCLSELVHSFFENDSSETEFQANDSDSELVDSVSDRTEALEDILQSVATSNVMDSNRKSLLAHVSEAVEAFSYLKSNRNVFRRNVMAFLRDLGYNAAICKTKWDSSGGVTAGNYEFVDVVQSSSTSTWQTRYFVDLDFASEFEIARPTCQYLKLLHSLPRVFVGTGEELKKLVKVMCDVAKRSLRSRELSMPPWRKNRYFQNKWLGPYRRTSNQAPATANSFPHMMLPVAAAKCRFVGFDDTVSDVNVNVSCGFIVRTR